MLLTRRGYNRPTMLKRCAPSDMSFLLGKGLLQAGPKERLPPWLTVPACICFSASTSTGRCRQPVDLELATVVRFWIRSTQIRLHLPMSQKPPLRRANEAPVLRVVIDDFGRANQSSRALYLEVNWQSNSVRNTIMLL
jgi:hypothetical protein